MTAPVVVVGGGVGGLAAALRLRRLGRAVTVVEAGSALGGLAAGFEARGVAFDGGPYVLLDRPGLDWAFDRLELDVDAALALRRIEHPYEVGFRDEEPVRIHADRDRTCDEIDRRWPGAGVHYRRFVADMTRVHARTLPLLFKSRPRPWDALSSLPFLSSSLRSVLARARLPEPLVRALAIWTHVAGQTLEEAPAPMALVPALVHAHGAWYPRGGLRAIPDTLAAACEDAGVTFRTRAPVLAIRCGRGRAVGVDLEDGDHVAASAVVSNFNGVGTYLELVGDVPPRARARLEALPLQSPGVGAWLKVKRAAAPPYLRFRIPAEGERCRLLVATAEADPACERDGWSPARIVAPMDHATAERLGETGQREFLERVLAETWWRDGVAEHEVVATRIPVEWGRRHHLYRESMNPVMTARFMRSGRIAHRSPHVRGLYLAGSSTHPGQWVSFCAISGIHAADLLHADRD